MFLNVQEKMRKKKIAALQKIGRVLSPWLRFSIGMV